MIPQTLSFIGGAGAAAAGCGIARILHPLFDLTPSSLT